MTDVRRLLVAGVRLLRALGVDGERSVLHADVHVTLVESGEVDRDDELVAGVLDVHGESAPAESDPPVGIPRARRVLELAIQPVEETIDVVERVSSGHTPNRTAPSG